MTIWFPAAVIAFILGATYPIMKPLVHKWTGMKPKKYSASTFGEMAAEGHSIETFFAGRDYIQWIAVKADLRTVVATWADLTQANLHRKNVTGERLNYDLRPGAQWLVYRYTPSEWSHIQLIHGAGTPTHHHLRELSQRTASEVLLFYGRNDFDKIRALACVRHLNGKPRDVLLVGEDADQDLLLEDLGLEEEEVEDLDFEFEFDAGRYQAARFLVDHGVAPRDLSGELQRMDLLVKYRP